MDSHDAPSNELQALRLRVAELEAERARSNAETFMHELFDDLFEGVQIVDERCRYVYVNNTAAAQGRRSRGELVGCLMSDVYPGIESTEMFELLRRCLTERTSEQLVNRFEYADGSVGWFDLRFRPVSMGALIFSIDISAEREAAARHESIAAMMQQSQKLEALGRLAAGVAHDFNNLLTVISGYSDIVLRRLAADDPARGPVAQIRKAGAHAAVLTRQLLAFSRQQVMEPTVVDLNLLVMETRGMLERVLGEDIEIATVCAPELDGVLVDPGKIDQVIMNLAVNARDAMPRGGQLTIETANVELDESYAATHVGVSPGPHVMLAVSDTGCGMDVATQARIFEPFFTTKDAGKGTGLGLATVFGIVKQSGGHIWLYSEPDRGTTFKIYLPVSGVVSRPKRASVVTLPLAGDETILVVDDDEAVREIIVEGLKGYGFNVLEASGGDEAIAIAKAYPHVIDVLMTDAIMPGVPGRIVAERIASLRPGIRILFVSGYTDDVVVRTGLVEKNVAFLQKPFMVESLARKIRALISG